MAFNQKTWVDRVSEYPRRRKLHNVVTAVESTVMVDRYEGTVLVEGDAFNAANMNDLEQRIADAVGSGLVESTTNIPVSDRNSGTLYFFY